MAKRINPFDPKVKKAAREAEKEKKVSALRKKVADLHKQALACEKAVDDHERAISKAKADALREDRAVTKQEGVIAKLQKQLSTAMTKLQRDVNKKQARHERISRMVKATTGKQRTCDGKFKRYNSAEDKLAKLTRLHLPKDM